MPRHWGLLGVPTSAGAHTPGLEKGPEALRQAGLVVLLRMDESQTTVTRRLSAGVPTVRILTAGTPQPSFGSQLRRKVLWRRSCRIRRFRWSSVATALSQSALWRASFDAA